MISISFKNQFKKISKVLFFFLSIFDKRNSCRVSFGLFYSGLLIPFMRDDMV